MYIVKEDLKSLFRKK